ncbi:MAG: sugar kinase [Chitinophagaceae bacterium]|nr:sugar kinase [Chitinophagaceae bacterium]
MEKPAGKSVQLAAFGEFLLRLHSHQAKRFQQTDGYTAYYAGAEANVCVLLARLGMNVNYISRVPDNDLAIAGIQQLKSHGVGTDHMVFGGDRLGLYFTESGNHIRSSRVIYDRTGTSFTELQPGMIDWKEVLKDTHCFHWSGVAAALSSSAAEVCREALETASDMGLTISGDFNYRSKLWQYGKHPKEIMPSLLQHSTVAVADLDAVNIYYGIETNKELPLEERFKQTVQQLQHKMPKLQTLGMSFRKTIQQQTVYLAALAHKGEYYFSEGYMIPHVTDQIGTGDAFTAGMLYGLMQQMPPQHIINFATACGALKQSIAGDWAIINRPEIEEFIQTGVSGRIIR